MRPGRSRLLAAAVVLAALVAGGFGGYEVGTRQSPVTALRGEARSSGVQASVDVDGWVYDVPIDGSIPWYSSDGTRNEGSAPACLGQFPPKIGEWTSSITFGYVNVSHGSATWRQVVWVQCP